jgi:steroid delta-isomerase-like uncharacterized protein
MNCAVQVNFKPSRFVQSDRRFNIRTLVAYFTAWNDHDLEGVLRTFAGEAAYQDPYWRGTISEQGFRRYVTRLWKAFPDLKMEVESLDQYDTDRAIAQWVLRGTNTGRMFGLRPSGRIIRVRGADFFEFQRGCIAGVTSHFDTFEMARQAGLEVVLREMGGARSRSGTIYSQYELEKSSRKRSATIAPIRRRGPAQPKLGQA